MHLWMVMTIFGNIAMAVGPLPADVDMDECQARVAERPAEIDEKFVADKLDKDPVMVVDGKRVTRADIKLACVKADKRPAPPKE